VREWQRACQSRSRVDDVELAAFCRRHGIRSLSLYGSASRSNFGAESDVDVLVEFEADHRKPRSEDGRREGDDTETAKNVADDHLGAGSGQFMCR
jgi:predicted nucleotidyltransferase